MASKSFSVYVTLMIMIAFMPSPIFSSYSQSESIPKVPTLSSSPATLTDPPPSSSLSPIQELSPDISPLLPSGGALPTPADSDIPTIPSNPSPPNPDEVIAPGPFNAFSPYGSVQATSNALRSVVCDIATTAFAGLAAAYLSLQYI